MTDAIRQVRARARRKAAGLVRLEFWVPADKRDQVRMLVGELLAEGPAVPAPIVVQPPAIAAPPLPEPAAAALPATPSVVPEVAGRRRRLITDIGGLLD
ncbi:MULTISPECIES: hypothetical protein [unclassified Azospirillum]|uniref:hypothetical protein n=1 Tax=unclassified Azospirillum TaxID=2630922 RepID=UPI000B731853|nr:MULTISPECIES: hypothetical protein [unclassified Azospirillum]SNS12109.1 hypothetical protein SAMN05880556_10268 [Azospirillum sp. RU38E]SNS29022.1 hypothetical protein SAMN05880591_10268 [Azospirillum sp. RU37A]